MYTSDGDIIKSQLSMVVSVVDVAYVNALKVLHERLRDIGVWWAIGGDLCEQLKTIPVKPDCIEIVTSQQGAQQIFQATKDLQATPLKLAIEKLTWNATVEGLQYPVYIKSYYFEFMLDRVKCKVYGDLQYRISTWDWGDKLEFTPEYSYLVGTKMALVPLQIKLELYLALGWMDRAEKIQRVLAKSHMAMR